MTYQAIRLFLLRWHRRLGLAAALFLIWISISGVLLNHTSWFSLAQSQLPVSLANSVYELEESIEYKIETSTGLVNQSDEKVFINGEMINQCEGQLRGAVLLSNELWLGCDQQALVLDAKHQLLEVFDRYFGLPTPLTRIGRCADNVCIESKLQTYQLTQSSGQWSAYNGEIDWSEAPKSQKLKAQLIPEIHNWERFILEAHSGRLFGAFGVYVFDLVALIAIILSLSGCYVWWLQYRQRRRRKSENT